MTHTGDAKGLSEDELKKLKKLYGDRLSASRIATMDGRNIFVDDLLATIADLQSQLRTAVAREAVLNQQASELLDHAFNAAAFIEPAQAARKNIDLAISRTKEVLANPSPAVQAVLDEVEGLQQMVSDTEERANELSSKLHDLKQRAEAAEARARTHGTVEVCSHCKGTEVVASPTGGPDIDMWMTCDLPSCPIRAKAP